MKSAMTSEEKKRGIFLAVLILAFGNVLVLYKSQVLSDAISRGATQTTRVLVRRFAELNVNQRSESESRPEYIVYLNPRPKEIEPELKTGRWLVLVYSVFSTDDVFMMRRTEALRNESGISAGSQSARPMDSKTFPRGCPRLTGGTRNITLSGSRWRIEKFGLSPEPGSLKPKSAGLSKILLVQLRTEDLTPTPATFLKIA